MLQRAGSNMKFFSPSLHQLYEMLHFIKENAEAAGFSPNEILRIELATEEALVNIINHGYIEESGSIEIFCNFLTNVGLKIIIKDKGISYNPLMANDQHVDVKAPLESRKIGGYGIFFILRIMDEVDYQREGNYNVLTLTKYIS